jgi:AcrR family transcriptional regulator
VSPRGVPNPAVRQQLFDAAEHVLERDGAQAVSGRAITREAKCATGLLYNHFEDLEEFLAALVMDRFRRQTEAWASLPERAGQGTVAANLVEIAVSLVDSKAMALAGLVASRPALASRVGSALAGGAPGFSDLTDSVTQYLELERALHRVSEKSDVQAVSFVLVAAAHQLLLGHSNHAVAGLEPHIARLVRVLMPSLEAELSTATH